MKALAALCLGWAGLLVGVSFLATPAKFRAPSLSLSVALDVGRQTFGVLNKVEWALIIIGVWLLLRLRNRVPRAVAASLGAVALIVILQSLWLLPVLDARVGQILAGKMPPPAPFHWIFIALETVKLGALCAASAQCLNALQNGEHRHERNYKNRFDPDGARSHVGRAAVEP